MLKVVGRLLAAVLAIAFAVVLVFAGTNAAAILTTQDDIVDQQAAASFDADAIIVLGASVYPDGTPSGILQDRLDDGIALYFAGAAPKIIMSGDNGTESYNECWAMKQYAILQGVPSEDVFCDHAGFSTYETMYRARHVFGADRVGEERGKPLLEEPVLHEKIEIPAPSDTPVHLVLTAGHG